MLQNTSTDNESPNGTPKRSDKFPLTLHWTGQYCKKIRGHMHYFGKIKYRYFYDQRRRLKNFARYTGPNERVSDIPTIRVQNYRQKLIKEGKAATTISDDVGTIKTMLSRLIRVTRGVPPAPKATGRPAPQKSPAGVGEAT